MQRLVEKIQHEFHHICEYIEINALDGNGDTFQVYHGNLKDLTTFYFSNILRFPSCFYFFNISSTKKIPEINADNIMLVRREICWLTDPLPPQITLNPDNSIVVTWPLVSFCGVVPTIVKDSIQYTLEIAEGIDYKPGFFSSFVSDVAAIDYKIVFNSSELNSAIITDLKPSKWYHARLIIDYLGVRVVSETQCVHTIKAKPGPPSIPRINIIPVRSSFDLKTEIPARLDLFISWHPGIDNGSKITKYQLQIQRFNANGDVIPSIEDIKKKEKKIIKKNQEFDFELPNRNSHSNQWVQSPGKSLHQIHNSIVISDRSPDKNKSIEFQEKKTKRDNINSSTYINNDIENNDIDRKYKWEIMHESAVCSTKKHSPTIDESEWHLRVRAYNSEGWSIFSNILKINSKTHPSLFLISPPYIAKGALYYMERNINHHNNQQIRSFNKILNNKNQSITPIINNNNAPTKKIILNVPEVNISNNNIKDHKIKSTKLHSMKSKRDLNNNTTVNNNINSNIQHNNNNYTMPVSLHWEHHEIESDYDINLDNHANINYSTTNINNMDLPDINKKLNQFDMIKSNISSPNVYFPKV